MANVCVGRDGDAVKECLRKRGIDFGQAKRMIQDRSEWRVCVRGNACGVAHGMNPCPSRDTIVVGCHMKPLKGGSPIVAEPTT